MLMSKQGNKKAASNFNSRFGYIMVAAGAAIVWEIYGNFLTSLTAEAEALLS